MRVALADLDRPAVAETAAIIEDELPDADVVSSGCDVSQAEEVRAMADAVFDRWQQVHVLCNNAGVFVGGLIWDRPPADFEFALGANLWGILNGIRSFVPRMIAQQSEGHVVNTSSVAGLFGAPFESPYAVSKFAAFAATESLAQDLEAVGSKIKASVLCPGIIATRIADSERHRPNGLATEFTEDQKFVTDYLAQAIADGMAPDEVAQMVLEAIRAERFLILTHDAYRPQLDARFEALVRRPAPRLCPSSSENGDETAGTGQGRDVTLVVAMPPSTGMTAPVR